MRVVAELAATHFILYALNLHCGEYKMGDSIEEAPFARRRNNDKRLTNAKRGAFIRAVSLP